MCPKSSENSRDACSWSVLFTTSKAWPSNGKGHDHPWCKFMYEYGVVKYIVYNTPKIVIAMPPFSLYLIQLCFHSCNWFLPPSLLCFVPNDGTLPSGVDGKSPNYMEGSGKIIEPNGEFFHYKVLIVGGHFSSYGIPWNSSGIRTLKKISGQWAKQRSHLQQKESRISRKSKPSCMARIWMA